MRKFSIFNFQFSKKYPGPSTQALVPGTRYTVHGTKSGFTILIAVVIASILLIIALAIGDIALKEKILTASGKESQIAFYAADTGVECALYWDQKQGVFSARNLNGSDNSGSAIPSPLFNCNGQQISHVKNLDTGLSIANIPGGDATVQFQIDNLTSDGACAIVSIRKTTGHPYGKDSNSDAYKATKVYTDIDSRGYNTCNSSLRRLERGILATY